MAITAVCPSCNKQFFFQEEQEGRAAHCSDCQQALLVEPSQPEQGASAPAEPARPSLTTLFAGGQRPAVGAKAERPDLLADEDEETPGWRRPAWVLGGALLLGGLVGFTWFLFVTETDPPAARPPRKTEPTVARKQEEEEPLGPVSAMPARDPEVAARLLEDLARRTKEAAEREPALIQQIRKTEAAKEAKEHGDETLAYFVTSQGNNQMALSPDGTTIALASEDKTVKVCDLPTCTIRCVLPAHAYQVTSVAFSPDGATLATSSFEGIRFWDPATGEQKSIVTDPEAKSLNRLAFSPDGELLAGAGSGGDFGRQFNSLRVVSARTGEPVKRFNVRRDPLSFLTFSPDGKVLATVGGYRGLRLWEVATGNRIEKVFEPFSKIRSVALSPDGQTLAVSARGTASPDEFVRLYGVYTEEKRTLREGLYGAGAVAFSPDGSLLAAFVDENDDKIGPRGVSLLDLSTGKQVARVDAEPVHGSHVKDVTFSRGGSLLIVSGYSAVSVHVVADLVEMEKEKVKEKEMKEKEMKEKEKEKDRNKQAETSPT